ncbi:hypothetical protein Ga0100231_013505 [Opitutaceae bacterium TAV4]|nr:hypothetical protein Ga0100231_013505 [Opitutaceae bacterium TAV4]RRJ99425.1 hypothetical protein Ga0100230_014810 [Opitutaceae bacterium TAV3]
MTIARKSTFALLAIFGLGLLHTQALADDHRIQGTIRVRDDATAIELAAAAKITIRDAIAAAEKAGPGTVVEAQLEEENRFAVWQLKVVTADKRIVELYIDAGDGKVLLTVPKR